MSQPTDARERPTATDSLLSEDYASRADTGLAPLPGWLERFQIQDVFTDRTHSRDFGGSRAEYMASRVRLLAFALAALTLTWVPVDLTLFEAEQAYAMAALRAAVSVSFLILGILSKKTFNLTTAMWRLAALVAIPVAGYFVARGMLGDAVFSDGILAGYFLLPFLLVALPAAFPVTLVEGATLCLVVIGTSALAEVAFGRVSWLTSEVGILSILSLIALGTGMSQLHMLLRLYRQATIDPLTGLYNRRTLMQRYQAELDRSRRYGTDLSVIFVDLDRFKRVNDEYGHLTGDSVLRACSQVFTSELRAFDFVGRYGGEEFLLVLPQTDLDGALKAAERVRSGCESSRGSTRDGQAVGVTVSAGITSLRPDDDATSLFNRVDDLLYEAKQRGRNRLAGG